MPATERLTVDVPSNLASAMRARVADGGFDSESEAVAWALEAFAEEDRGLDTWLNGPVAEAYDAVDAGTGAFFSADEVKARFGPKT